MSKLYNLEDLKYKSYHDLYQICKNERIVEGISTDKINKNELINLILKFRGERPKYTIDEYSENGMFFLQELFDRKLNIRLNDDYRIKVPHRIVMYKDLALSGEDKYKVILPNDINNRNAFLVNAQNYLCGIFTLEKDLETMDTYFLTSNSKDFRIEEFQNENFSLIFFNDVDSKFLYDFYYGRTDKYPYSLDYYRIKIDQFEMKDLEKTNAVLCVDFGTTNTTAGAYLDENYVKEKPYNDIKNGKVVLNEINYVTFPVNSREKSVVYPTVVYIEDCAAGEKINYVFGHEVKDKLKKSKYILNGSIFYGIKNWIYELDKEEKVVDTFGNIKYIPRREIIGAYMESIMKRAEYQFKCKFQKIHISSPVRLKEQYLNLFEEVMPNYTILKKGVLDEGISVMYNTIEKYIKSHNFEDGERHKAFIIDCGGGTTELATCEFEINRTEVFYNLEISTSFENSEENFGGNNITYRIMQYLKILLAYYYKGENFGGIESMIPYNIEEIYRHIDKNGIKSIYEMLEDEYKKTEMIIPTRYTLFENKSSEEYKKIKNNFYFLWEAAEALKHEFFNNYMILRTRFDYTGTTENGETKIVPLESWNLNVLEKGLFKEINAFPTKVFNMNEIHKLIKGDIYEVVRKFLTPYYESGELYEYSVIKLSGQSCKIPLFNEVLKEFVPGKLIDFKVRKNDNPYELKLNCLNGSIRYLNSTRFGDIKVELINEIPSVPYSITGLKYTGEEIEILRTGKKIDNNIGHILKGSNTMEIKLNLRNLENELKREYIYINTIEDYVEKTADGIIIDFENKINQKDLDSIEEGLSKFFVYTDDKSWGFYVRVVKREEDNLFIGRKKYYSFDNKDDMVSYFDGEH